MVYRQQLLSHGLFIANAPLTPAERKVLLGLLDGHGKADRARTRPKSEHDAFPRLVDLRQFGVRNRSALAALWLGKLQ